MMPGTDCAVLAKKVRECYPQVLILALSMSGERALVNSMLEDANIAGCALKNIGKTELVTTIRRIHNGPQYFSQEVLDELKREVKKDKFAKKYI